MKRTQMMRSALLLAALSALWAGCGDPAPDESAVVFNDVLTIPFIDVGSGPARGEGPQPTGEPGTGEPTTGPNDPDGESTGREDPDAGEFPDDTEEALDGTDSTDGEDVAPCVPSCAAKACGPDGCGGDCGGCAQTHACISATCRPVGDSCSSAILIPSLSGWSFQGSTEAAQDGSQACGLTAPSGDVFFVLDYGGVWQLSVEADWDATLAVTAGCEANECLGSGPQLVLESSGVPMVIAVESASGGQSGPFELLVQSCQGACPPGTCGVGKCGITCQCESGDTCIGKTCTPMITGDGCAVPPLPVAALPFTDSRDLTGFTDTLSCPQQGAGPDLLYGLNPSAAVSLTLTLDSASPDAFASLVVGDCQAGCEPASQFSPGSPLGAHLAAEVPAWIVVEPAGQPFELSLVPCTSDACGPLCPCGLAETCQAGVCVGPSGGDGCGDAVALGLGTTSHSLHGLTNTQSCNDADHGADAVFTFAPGAASAYRISAVAGPPMVLGALATCGQANTCLATTAPGAPLDLNLASDSDAVTVVAESATGPPGSGFTLEVVDCTAACQDQPCDSLVCGKLCGCEASESCVDGSCQPAGEGQSCATAFEIDEAPAVRTGTLTGFPDTLGCGPGQGLGTPDAVFRFVAPETGAFVATVAGAGVTLLRAGQCVNGGQSCATPPNAKQSFLAHAGDTVTLAVDGEADSAYTLSVVRLFGSMGTLGAPCESAANCPLADDCQFGVCTVTCTPGAPDKACLGAAAGPRGSQYACAADLCFEIFSGGGCAHLCLPGAAESGSSACLSQADCASDSVCAGWTKQGGACVAAGALGLVGAPCDLDTGCASHVCVDGTCRALCQTTAQCEANSKCRLQANAPDGVGVCQIFPLGTGDTSCADDAGCSGNQLCEGHITPSKALETYCVPADPGLLSVGAACEANAECQTGRCLFVGFQGFQPAYCTEVCPTDSDCPDGLSCHPSAGDGPALPLCFKGSSYATCPLGVPDVCTAPLTCTDLFGSGPLGVCQ